MWYVLAHILYVLHKLTGNTVFSKQFLRNLMLKKLDIEDRDLNIKMSMPVYDTEEQLSRDLSILRNLNIVRDTEEGIVLNIEALERFEKLFEGDGVLSNKETLSGRVLKRLEEAITREVSVALM